MQVLPVNVPFLNLQPEPICKAVFRGTLTNTLNGF